MKIAVAGLGYVGMANAVLLAQHNSVVAIDIDAERVDMVNNRHTTIVDPLIAEYLAHHNLDLRATTDPQEAYRGADFVVIATPTNYDPGQNYFDTSSVDEVLDLVQELALTRRPSLNQQSRWASSRAFARSAPGLTSSSPRVPARR